MAANGEITEEMATATKQLPRRRRIVLPLPRHWHGRRTAAAKNGGAAKKAKAEAGRRAARCIVMVFARREGGNRSRCALRKECRSPTAARSRWRPLPLFAGGGGANPEVCPARGRSPPYTRSVQNASTQREEKGSQAQQARETPCANSQYVRSQSSSGHRCACGAVYARVWQKPAPPTRSYRQATPTPCPRGEQCPPSLVETSSREVLS